MGNNTWVLFPAAKYVIQLICSNRKLIQILVNSTTHMHAHTHRIIYPHSYTLTFSFNAQKIQFLKAQCVFVLLRSKVKRRYVQNLAAGFGRAIDRRREAISWDFSILHFLQIESSTLDSQQL